MTQSFLYVMDPIESINPAADTTYSFMMESQRRGINNFYCTINDLYWDDDKVKAITSKIEVEITKDSHFKIFDSQKKLLSDFNVIFMRKDPPVNEDFFVSTMLLDYAKTIVINNPTSLRIANEKLWGLGFGNLMPKTMISSSKYLLLEKAKQYKKVVLKPLFHAGGAGVLIFDHDDKNLVSSIELLTKNGQSPIVMQQYIDGARDGDKRVIVLGGEPIGVLLRVPAENDHRANMHAGGSVFASQLNHAEIEICKALKPHLLKLGLHFVGLDIISNKLTEINVTSPTGIQEINRLEKRVGNQRLESIVMDYVAKLAI